MSREDELRPLAVATRDYLAAQIGPRATVIVLIADEQDGHSWEYVAIHGPCLPVLGLLAEAPRLVRKILPKGWRESGFWNSVKGLV